MTARPPPDLVRNTVSLALAAVAKQYRDRGRHSGSAVLVSVGDAIDALGRRFAPGEPPRGLAAKIRGVVTAVEQRGGTAAVPSGMWDAAARQLDAIADQVEALELVTPIAPGARADRRGRNVVEMNGHRHRRKP